MAPVGDDRRVPRLERRGRRRGRRGCGRRVPRVVAAARGAARGDPDGCRRRDRAARRADRAGHDARDGQAAARGADGSGPRRCDPPLLRRRGLAAEGRAVRAVGDRQLRLHRPPPARRRRPDHALELPGGDPCLEDRSCAGLRQHGGDEARAGGTADRPPPRRLPRGGGYSRRGLQHRRRPRLGGRHAAGAAPEGEGDLVHGVGRGRPSGPRGGDGARQARPARARRPQPADRDGRRRSRPGRRSGLRGRLLVGRPEVHGHAADLRPGCRLRRLPRRGCSTGSSAAPSATLPTRTPRSARS